MLFLLGETNERNCSMIVINLPIHLFIDRRYGIASVWMLLVVSDITGSYVCMVRRLPITEGANQKFGCSEILSVGFDKRVLSEHF